MAEIVDLGSASESENDIVDSDVSSSCDVDPDRVKANLVDLLDNVKSPGTFACSVDLKTDFVDPKITVGGVGPIQLPLTPDAARAIAQASHQAPFGRGEETVVDASVRNTWELNPGNFAITEPKWTNEFLPKVLRAVGDELGVFSSCRSIRCKLYKMLLYEKGAMFKPHRDSEKTPGMFGTLVICLPSPHEGGDVHTSHARHNKILKSSDCISSFLAWYSDVEHEVREVTAGYRWVLTYNLVADGPTGPVSAAATLADRIDLRRNLKAWKTECTLDPSYRDRIVHLLNHRYTDASLQLSSLKGRDRRAANLLKESCDSVGFKLFLASFERMRSGAAEPNPSDYDEDEYGDPYDEDLDDDDWGAPKRERSHHFIDEEFESSIKLTRVIELSGTEVAQNIDIDIKDIVQEDTLDDYDLDDEEYEGYTGNAGCTATHWYRMTALVIVPQERVAQFLLSQFDVSYSSRFGLVNEGQSPLRDQRLRNLVQTLRKEQRKHQSEDQCRKTLAEVCRYALKCQKEKINARNQLKSERTDELLGAVVSAAASLRDISLFNEATALVRTELPLEGLDPVARWIRTDGFRLLRTGLEQALPRAFNIGAWSEYLAHLGSCGGTDESYDKDDEEYEIELSPKDQDFEAWEEEKMCEVLQKTSKVWLEDSLELASILKNEKSSSGKYARALQLLLEHSKNTPAMVRFLVFFRGLHMSKPEEMDFSIFKPVLSSTLHWFSLSMEPRTVRLDAAHVKEGERLPPVEGDLLSSLLLDLRDNGLNAELNDVCEKIKAEICRMNVLDLDPMVSSFLEGLVKMSRPTPADVMSQPFRSLFETILEKYALRYVGKKPSKKPDWTTPEIRCRCLGCREMNEFLRDPEQRVIRWKATKKERRHLHQELNYTSCDHRTDHMRDPNTMVVTKTQDRSKEERKRWDERVRHLGVKLDRLRKLVDLTQILGVGYSKIRSILGITGVGPSGTGPPVVPLTDASLALKSTCMKDHPGRMQGTARWIDETVDHGAQPLASTSGNCQRPPATPGPSNARRSESTPMKNTPESREAVKRKASEMEGVDLTVLRNTEEMRREVRQKTTDVEVLDLTAD